MPRPVPFISRVKLRNYKSIAECDVRLGPLTVLVGPNGSGKSNFLDALAFVAEAVGTTPAQAIESRGGLGEILRRVPEPTESFTIELEVVVPWGPTREHLATGHYSFEFTRTRPGRGSYLVTWEECELTWQDISERFRVEYGMVDHQNLPTGDFAVEADRLYLPLAAARPNLAPLYAALRGMYFYNPDPAVLRQLRQPTGGAALGPHGEYLGEVLGALDTVSKQRFDAYLTAVVPGALSVDRRFEGSYVTVELRTSVGPAGGEVAFGPESMSDGTIRAAGLLAALHQPGVASDRIRLVGIEEPELALHPAAAGVLFDALTEASERVQTVVTTQSPDLLDREDFDVSCVRAVAMGTDGLTVIDKIDDASRRIVEEKLYTLGELMRGNQLSPRIAPTGDA